MINKENKKRLNSIYEEIRSLFIGHNRDDINYLFEKIVPWYIMQSRTPWEEGKYMIVERKTGKEFNPKPDWESLTPQL